MTERDRTVQVPVAQLEKWRDDIRGLLPPGTYAIRQELDALLSQPTPTADEWAAWERCEGPRPDGLDDDAPLPTLQPPRIEDMAPGKLPCEDPNVNRWYCHRRATDGTCPLTKCIDPSMIRDVTPPADVS